MANYEEHKKMDYRTNLVRPAAVFADPSYTFSVPPFQTACGIVDIMSILTRDISATAWEASRMDSPRFSRRLASAWPESHDVSEGLRVEGAASVGGGAGNHAPCDQGRDFVGNLHSTEKMLSGYFSLPHGAGIAIVSLAWFKYSLNDATAPRYARWGRNVWGNRRKPG